MEIASNRHLFNKTLMTNGRGSNMGFFSGNAGVKNLSSGTEMDKLMMGGTPIKILPADSIQYHQRLPQQ